MQVQAGSDGGRACRPVGRARRPAERRSRRAAAPVGAGCRWSPGRGAPRSGGPDRQRRQGGDRPVGRARRPTGPGFRPAATAEAGAGPGASAGCGVSRGGGSGWQRGRRWGPAGRSGAAERGGAAGGGAGGGFAVPASPGRRGRPPLKPLPLFDLGEYVGRWWGGVPCASREHPGDSRARIPARIGPLAARLGPFGPVFGGSSGPEGREAGGRNPGRGGAGARCRICPAGRARLGHSG